MSQQAQPLEDVQVIRPRPGAAVVELRGEHDLVTAGEMEELLRDLTTKNALVVVDVTDTEFIDSSVLHNLVKADQQARAAGNRFVLQMGTAPAVRTAIEVSGLLNMLDCAPSREQALEPARK
jgi:anti-sigma B factor antagonist